MEREWEVGLPDWGHLLSLTIRLRGRERDLLSYSHHGGYWVDFRVSVDVRGAAFIGKEFVRWAEPAREASCTQDTGTEREEQVAVL